MVSLRLYGHVGSLKDGRLRLWGRIKSVTILDAVEPVVLTKWLRYLRRLRHMRPKSRFDLIYLENVFSSG